MQLYWFVLLPIMIALLGYICTGINRKYLILFSQIIYLVMAVSTLVQVHMTGQLMNTLGNYPRGISITLRADAITAVFVLLNVFLFSVMLLFNYHKHYMNKLFLFLFLVLEGLINGIFLSGDLFNLYVLIEVSTIVVSILIMYKRDTQSIYDGMIYLFTNLLSMTFFLFGIGYIYKIFGVLDMQLIKDSMPLVTHSKSLLLPYAFLLTAVGFKSAIMPLFSWLPRAHGTPSAPSIVSAILSGLYVKGGIYLFIRMQDVFQFNIETHQIYIIMGLLTAIFGFVLAVSQDDIKLILAYSTISQIGLILVGVSMKNDYSYWGSMYHIVNHAISKSTLFLAAGIIIETYKTRNIREIRGVFRRMPFIACIIIFAILGITGAPLFGSSISKYYIQKGNLTSNVIEMSLIVINLGTIVTYIKYAAMLFGKSDETSTMTWNQKLSLSVLAGICLLGGVLGPVIINMLFNVSLSVKIGDYLIKSTIYLVSILIGFIFYRYVYKHMGVLKKIRDIELNFNQIVLLIASFFVFQLVYLHMTL